MKIELEFNELDEKLSDLFDTAIEARDRAQEVSSAILEYKRQLQTLHVEALTKATKHLD